MKVNKYLTFINFYSYCVCSVVFIFIYDLKYPYITFVANSRLIALFFNEVWWKTFISCFIETLLFSSSFNGSVIHSWFLYKLKFGWAQPYYIILYFMLFVLILHLIYLMPHYNLYQYVYHILDISIPGRLTLIVCLCIRIHDRFYLKGKICQLLLTAIKLTFIFKLPSEFI